MRIYFGLCHQSAYWPAGMPGIIQWLMNQPPFTPALPCAKSDVDVFLSTPSDAVVSQARAWHGDVLVLGAGGKMGLHVSMMLNEAIRRASAGARVVAVSRFQTLHDREAFEKAGIATIVCDLHDERAVASLPDASLVFFLAGVKFGTASNPASLRAMNIEVPRLVAGRFRKARIVALSTGCVYPFTPVSGNGATEQTPPAPLGDYATSCLGREEEFSTASACHRTPVALIRLNYSVEFRYGVLVDIAVKVMRGEPVDVTTGSVNVIWQRDAIEHIIRAAEHAASPPVVINITGAGIHSVRRIASDFGKLFGVMPRIIGEESSKAWLSNAAYAHALFGAPSVTLETMEQWIVAWLQSDGSLWGKPTGFETRDGKF